MFPTLRPGRSVEAVPSYLVETYLARGDAGRRVVCERRARSVAAELTGQGTPVRFDRTIHLPEDEICFFVFEAPSATDTALAAQRAELGPLRVVEAILSGEENPMKPNDWILVIAVVAVIACGAGGALAGERPAPRLAGVGTAPEPGPGVESDLRRDPDCDGYGELVEPASRRDRPHGHLRCLQRDQAPVHADLRPERRRQRAAARSSWSVAASSGHRRRVHDAGGPVSARATQLGESYAASLAALSDHGGDGGKSRERGIAWGTQVAQAVLAWRGADGFNTSYPAFIGGTAVGQWRPIPPASSMSAQALAFTAPFVLESNTQFRPGPPRTLASATYTADFNAVKALGRRTGSTRTEAEPAARSLLGGQRQRPLEPGGQPDRAHQPPFDVRQQSAPRRPELAMADTVFTIWNAKRHYGGDPPRRRGGR